MRGFFTSIEQIRSLEILNIAPILSSNRPFKVTDKPSIVSQGSRFEAVARSTARLMGNRETLGDRSNGHPTTSPLPLQRLFLLSS